MLSGSVPKSLPKDIYAQIAKLAQTKGVRLIVDAAGDLLLSTLEFQPFLVKPNREELSEMFRAPADTEEQVTALAEELKKRGAKNVLVSMAGDGALLYTETGEVYFCLLYTSWRRIRRAWRTNTLLQCSAFYIYTISTPRR